METTKKTIEGNFRKEEDLTSKGQGIRSRAYNTSDLIQALIKKGILNEQDL